MASKEGSAWWGQALDMDSVYRSDHMLDPSERRRTERLELLDEVEEFRLLLRHYVLALGVSRPSAATPDAASASPSAAGGGGDASGSGIRDLSVASGLAGVGGSEGRRSGAIIALDALRLINGGELGILHNGEAGTTAAAGRR